MVSDLASFHPQHIFVEATEGWPPAWFDGYKDFKEHKLPEERWMLTNEIFQVGIKTALKINLPQGVTPVDWQLTSRHYAACLSVILHLKWLRFLKSSNDIEQGETLTHIRNYLSRL